MLGQEIIENQLANKDAGPRWIRVIASTWAKEWAIRSTLSGPGFETPRERLVKLASAIADGIRLRQFFQAEQVDIEDSNVTFFTSQSGFIAINEKLDIYRGSYPSGDALPLIASQVAQIDGVRLTLEQVQTVWTDLRLIPALTLEQAFGDVYSLGGGQFDYRRARAPQDIPFIHMADTQND